MQGLGEEAVRRAEGTHQHDGDDDDGHVAVDDGSQAAGEAALEGAVEALAAAQLFLDALGSDDVGVNAHADGEDDAGDAGQGQGEALKHREVTGDEGQRSRHLTSQSDAGQEAGQTVQSRHQNHDEGEGDDAGQHHGAEAVLAQAGADGRIAVHRQSERQRAGVDLAGHLDDILLGERVGCRAGAAGLVQLGSGIAERLGTLVRKLERDIVFRAAAADRAVLGRCTLHHGAVQDELAVGTAPLPERQVGGGADFLNGGFRVEIRLTGLPRELEDEAVRVVIHIQLIVGHIESHQTVFNDELGCFQLVIGRVIVIGRDKGHIDTALDVHTKADVLCAFEVGSGHITILDRNAKECRIDKRRDQKHSEDKLPCFAFSFHMNRETSKYNKKLFS